MPGFYISLTLLVSTWAHWHKLWPKAGCWTTASGTRIRWFRWGPVEISGWKYPGREPGPPPPARPLVDAGKARYAARDSRLRLTRLNSIRRLVAESIHEGLEMRFVESGGETVEKYNMNWLDPKEVEAWLADSGRMAYSHDRIAMLDEALEHFVRAIAEIDFITLKYPERASSLLVEVNDVARLLVKAMGEK